MGVLTTRAGLYMPGGGSLSLGGDDEAADIDKINESLQRIDQLLGLYECEHATRPGENDRFPGMLIYETDTGNAFYWSDTSNQWKQLTIPVGTSAPADPEEGFLWVDTN